MNKKINDYFSVVISIVIILYLASFFVINFKGLNLIYDSDMYADTLIAKYIWEQKTFFPDNWVFSNQCFIIQTPVLSAIIYGICNDMFLSMKIATTIMTLLIIASYIWMIKPFVNNKTVLNLGVLLILSSAIGCEIGKQYEGQLFYLTVSYYASYLLTLLVVGGCFARIVSNIDNSKILIILSLLLSFACGMQSLRQTVLMVLPLLFCCLFFRKRKALIYSIEILFFNVLGIMVINLINPTFNTLYGSPSLLSIKFWFDRFIYGLNCIKKITGLRWLIKGNLVGIIGLFYIIVVLVVIFVVIKNIDREDGLVALILLFLVGMCSTLSVCVITEIELRYIYLFSWFPLVSVSFVYILNKSKNLNLYSLLVIMIIITSLANLAISYGKEIKESFIKDESIEKEVAIYIRNNNYKYVYGEWTILGKYMSYVGNSAIGGSWYNEPFCIIGYLNPQNIYGDNENKKAVYLITKNDIEKSLEIVKEMEAKFTQVAEFDEGNIVLYESDKQLMHFD